MGILVLQISKIAMIGHYRFAYKYGNSQTTELGLL